MGEKAIEAGSGISYVVAGGQMVITIDLTANPDATTKSGKNHMVATTGPAQAVTGGGLKPGAKLQINLYEPLA